MLDMILKEYSIHILILSLLILVILLYLSNRNLRKTLTKSFAKVDSSDLEMQIRNMIQSGEKETEIIKYIRKDTGLGLIEAKQFFDSVHHK